MPNPSKRIDPKILEAEIKARIRGAYFYFLGFYLLSLIVAFFSKSWSGFFYWPAFHGSIIFFTLLFGLTFEANFLFKSSFRISNFKFKRDLRFIGLVQNSLRQAGVQFRRYFIFVYFKLSGLGRRTWLKILLIAAVLIFSLFKEIYVLDWLVLFYALVSFIFILDSRWAAGAALVFLASCPLLLIFKNDILAEGAAIYAYYFLVITVLTQIRELRRERNLEKNKAKMVVESHY